MNQIITLLTELGRCQIFFDLDSENVRQYAYNGIAVSEGVETYQVILKKMYNAAFTEIAHLNDKEVIAIEIKITETATAQQNFDIPTSEAMTQMESDFQTSHNRNLKNQIEACKFYIEMSNAQKLYLKELRKNIGLICKVETAVEPTEKNTPIEEITEQSANSTTDNNKQPPRYLKGIQALADYLHISKSKAQKLKNEHKIPFTQDVRIVLFDREKVDKALGEKAFAKTVKQGR